MRCWRDDSSYDGTVRWFWVTGGGYAGFASANQITKQTRVGSCSNDHQVSAVLWAGSRLGQDIYRKGKDGYCQQFVHDAYRQGAKVEIGGAGTAYKYWKTDPKHYARTPSTKPPVGYLAYWKAETNNSAGHVALSIGNGWAISSMERENSGGAYVIHVMSIADRNRTKPWAGALAAH